MEVQKKNDKGITILYVMMALLVVSFIGVSLMNITIADSKASAYYGTSESARIASLSGVFAGVSAFESPQKNTPAFDSLISRLMVFVNADSLSAIPDSVRWILGTDSTYEDVGGVGGSYRVYIEALDVNSMTAQLRVDALGFGSSKATNKGLYRLDGLILDTVTVLDTTVDTSFVPMAAFRLGGNSDFESNCDVQVDGLAYLNSKLTVNSSDIIFNGPFIQEKGTFVTILSGNKMTFNGPTYIGGHFEWSSTVVEFNDKVGFDGGLYMNALPTVGGTVYHNGNNHRGKALHFNGWDKNWNMNGNSVISKSGLYSNGAVTESYWDLVADNVGSFTRTTSTMNILDSLGLADIEAPELEIKDSILNTVTHQIVTGTANADVLNAAAQAAQASGDTLCGGFAVIRSQGVTNDQITDRTGSNLITEKFVFIWDYNQSMKFFPECASTANVIIIARNTNNMKIFGGSDYLRGVVFVETVGFQLQPGNPTVIDGATYYSPTAQHYNNSGVGVVYKYNPDVLREASCMGLIYDPTDSVEEVTEVVSVRDTLILDPAYDNIVPVLRARSF